MKPELYDLRIVFESDNPGVTVYKEFKSRTLGNVLYWIEKAQKWNDVKSFDIKPLQ